MNEYVLASREQVAVRWPVRLFYAGPESGELRGLTSVLGNVDKRMTRWGTWRVGCADAVWAEA